MSKRGGKKRLPQSRVSTTEPNRFGPNDAAAVREQQRVAQIFARDRRAEDHERQRLKALREHEDAAKDAERRKQNPPPLAIPDRPAKLRPVHVASRELSPNAGGKKGWTVIERPKKKEPLDIAFANEKITHAQYQVGKRYREAYRKINPPGVDCLSERVSGSRSQTALWAAELVADANKELRNMHRRLSPANRTIIKYFCGKGWTMAEAIREARIPYHPDAVVTRIQEALNDLMTRGREAKAA